MPVQDFVVGVAMSLSAIFLGEGGLQICLRRHRLADRRMHAHNCSADSAAPHSPPFSIQMLYELWALV